MADKSTVTSARCGPASMRPGEECRAVTMSADYVRLVRSSVDSRFDARLAEYAALVAAEEVRNMTETLSGLRMTRMETI